MDCDFGNSIGRFTNEFANNAIQHLFVELWRFVISNLVYSYQRKKFNSSKSWVVGNLCHWSFYIGEGMKKDKNFKLSKSAKRILAALSDKEQRRLWKEAYISAELNDSPKMAMSYDVSPSGKIPRKVQERPDVNA
jgi:hypothetical protein